MSRSRPFSAFVIAALALPLARPVHSADVVIVLNPKCALDPKSVDLSNKTGTFPYRVLNSRSAGTFSEAPSIKDVKVTGETFVVELLATNVTPGTRTERFTLDGGPGPTPVTYKVAALRQPYKVWYLKGRDEKPVLLAESVATGSGSEVKHLSAERVRISKLTPAEVAARGMIDVHNNGITERLVDAFADKVIAGKPRPGDHPLFRPKVTYGPKGDATVEIGLHNRLPVGFTGSVSRTRTLEEGRIESALLNAGKNSPLNDSAKFDLAPGEKAALTISVPAEFVTKAKLTSASMIRLVYLDLSPPRKR